MVATVVLAIGAAVAYAWTVGTSNPGNSISALSLGSPAPVTAPPPTTEPCSNILLSWTSAPNADRYRVEVNTSGTWTTLAASHTTTSISDTTGYANLTIDYRVTPLLSGTSWEGTPATATTTCGMGDVSDLTASNGCNDVVLAWSAVPNADRYEVWVSRNGAAATALTTNLTGTTTYTDTSTYAAGDVLAYQVRPRIGGSAGNFSNTAKIASWGRFRIMSIAVANAGTLGALDAGDTVTVTFSKPVDTGTATSTQLIAKANQGTRGLWIAASGMASSTTEIGHVGTGNNLVGDGTLPGSVAWSADNTVWTWTSTGPGPAMSSDLAGTFSAGTSPSAASCAAGGSGLDTSVQPTLGGRW